MRTPAGRPCLVAAAVEWLGLLDMAGEPPNHRVSGPLVQIMEIIGDQLQTCVEFVIPADNKYGSQLPNGTWTGVIEMVRRRSSLSVALQSVIPSDILPLPPSLSVVFNQLFPPTQCLFEVNMSGVTLSIDAPRAELVDFSVPLFMDEHVLTYRRPVYEYDLLGFIKPYTAQGPGEAQAGAKQTVQGHLWSSAYLTLALLLGQSVPRLPSASALRVMAGVWLLSALIVSSVYRSNLKAMLILPKLRLPFDSMDELLEANIPTYVADGTMLYQKMMVSPPDSFLGRLRAQTVTYLDTPRAIRELLLGRHATFTGRAIGQSVIHQIFEQVAVSGNPTLRRGPFRTPESSLPTNEEEVPFRHTSLTPSQGMRVIHEQLRWLGSACRTSPKRST
ncbi:Variant Ionotropic Glutamate Receptor [Penaeus vannamei]|uniref:Variant Ionotropic Glutamate Receptor n=1 Tax=Penaeus vannamei TaxID=6689 RepID=A0A3R7PY52_PENVA|nr:Variant Ionotropic Glutamate Receptor [Penaeus vannamei]